MASWLDETISLDFVLVESLLNSYFDKLNKDSTIQNSDKYLTSEEIDKLKKLYIANLFKRKNVDECKDLSISLTYRELFKNLSSIYNPLNVNVDELDITTEIYQLTQYFFEEINEMSIYEKLLVDLISEQLNKNKND
jgi:hypothetical protein